MDRRDCSDDLRSRQHERPLPQAGRATKFAPLNVHGVLRVGDWIGVLTSLSKDAPAKWTFQELAKGYWAGPVLQAEPGAGPSGGAVGSPIIMGSRRDGDPAKRATDPADLHLEPARRAFSGGQLRGPPPRISPRASCSTLSQGGVHRRGAYQPQATFGRRKAGRSFSIRDHRPP